MQNVPYVENEYADTDPGFSTGVLKGSNERRDMESFWKLNHSPGMWGVSVVDIFPKACFW
jgi:hypothetical protein